MLCFVLFKTMSKIEDVCNRILRVASKGTTAKVMVSLLKVQAHCLKEACIG